MRLRPILMSALLSTLSVPALALDKIDIMLSWFITPNDAVFVVGEETGIFKKHDISVHLIEPSDPSLPPKLVAAGQVDVAVSYQPQLHVQVDQGLPVSRISTLVATPLNTLVTLESSGIQTIADLKGKKIGYSVSGFEDALLNNMLKSAGLNNTDVERVNINWAITQSLLSGQVDAVIGAYRNFELNQLALENHPATAFYVEEYGVPSYDEMILIAHNDHRHEDKYRRLNAAMEETVQYLLNHPEQSWQTFITKHPNLNDELNRLAWNDTLPRFALRPGAVEQRRYQRMAEFLQAQGLIQNPIPEIAQYAIEP